MLDQKSFGEKLRNHRKRLGMTQEEVASQIGVSAQAISKWESGDCLPDCFNLKAISDVYHLSADVLLETERNADIDAVASKIEQLGTEFIWANAADRYQNDLHKELGEDLWKMWKGIYFAEVGDREKQQISKQQGSLRIIGTYGTKIWDDDGIACVVQSSLIGRLKPSESAAPEVLREICTAEGQKLILALSTQRPTSKQDLIEKTDIPLPRLNELLLLLTENGVIEFVSEHDGFYGWRHTQNGYLISGHFGIAAYMVLAAMYILDKKRNYGVSQYFDYNRS